MKILITGGAGFLGKHLCRAVAAAGHEVQVLDLRSNPEFPTIQADIRDTEKMKTVIVGFDAVFHLAALIEAGESVKFPQSFVDSNISGTVSILEAMKVNRVPICIFSSSAAVYGEPLSTPISEDDRTLPINPYGMTKLAMEGLMASYCASQGMSGAGLRYFNLYGPEEHHQPETHAIPRFIEQIENGAEVTVYGNGEHQRDYIHVSDVVSAHLLVLEYCLTHPKQYHYFNLSTETPTAVVTLVSMLEETMGKKATVSNLPNRPGDPLILTASAQKARQELGWSPQVSLREGLVETVAYFRKFHSTQ